MGILLAGDAGTGGAGVYASPGPVISYNSKAGNTLIVTGSLTTTAAITGITSITDSAGNAWSYSTVNDLNPPSVVNVITGGYICGFIGWALDTQPVTSVTITGAAGTASTWRVSLSEWYAVSRAGMTSDAAAATGANPQATLDVLLPDDVLTGVVVSQSDVPSALPAGWLPLSGAGGGSTYIGYATPDLTGLYQPEWTMASDAYAFAVMTFRSTGATSVPSPSMRAF